MGQSSDTGTMGKVPEDVSEVREVIQRHHKHFIEDTTGETVYQQLENERSIRREYSGRVLFELLQNALDRAESKVHVQIREIESRAGGVEKFLVVANDGGEIRGGTHGGYRGSERASP